MNLESALSEIRSGFATMSRLYGEPVFDEWVVVALGEGGGAVKGYEGPRAAKFLSTFKQDVSALSGALAGTELDAGGFAFGVATHGQTYDALMRVGPAAYLLANHTTRSMEEIRAKPQWLKAQGAWFVLGEKFRADALA